MVNPKTLDLIALPSLLLSDRRSLPTCACVYFAMSSGVVQYIGRSVNLQNRWKSHHQCKSLKRDANISWLEISDISLLTEIESALIEWFKPPLNRGFAKPNKLDALPTKSWLASVWKLRQIMADKRITNQELADKINAITGKKIHAVTISRWKSFDVMPKINGAELDAIIESLGVSRNDLLGEQ